MESIHFDKKYREEYKQQFRNMTDEQIEYHIGLEKVRNVIEGFDRNFGIDEIRKLVEVKNEKNNLENRKNESGQPYPLGKTVLKSFWGLF